MPDYPKTMTAILLTGHGGFDKLKLTDDFPVPPLSANEVLIRVGAAGINNTDINTRIGWYSKTSPGSSKSTEKQNSGEQEIDNASWTGEPLRFPRIQGADCCGRIVAVGSQVNPKRVGERVLVRTLLRSYVGFRAFECWTYGSECDGAFAEYSKVASDDVFAISSDWSDTELASIPCAYSTAEGMLSRTNVKKGEKVLIAGASGGVGSAAVQLAARRGAIVYAISGADKARGVRELGADYVIDRAKDLSSELGGDKIDVVIDIVAGSGCQERVDALRIGGRYALAGAIAGPIVQFDIRTLYLRDISFFGCTFQEDEIFPNLIGYIERGEIKPAVANTYPFKEIERAQKDFLEKKFVGKLVLVPPTPSNSTR